MYPCICSWNWTRYRVPAFDLSPYPLSVPLLASAARQSVGSSSPWAPGSASGLKAAFWPRRAPSSHPQVPYGWSRTPNITRKQKQLTQLIQFLSPHVRCAHFSCLHSTTHHPWFLLLEQLDYIQMPLFFVVTVYIVFIPFISLLGFLQEACFLLHDVLQRSKEPCCRYMSLRGGQLKKRTWILLQFFLLISTTSNFACWITGFELTSSSRSLLRKFLSSQWYSYISGGPTDFSVASSNSILDILANSPTFSCVGEKSQ